MAQLRDKKTSAFLFEGTPLEVATLATKVGLDEVIFDDVGLGFDPQAVLDAHAEHKAAVKDIEVSDEHKQQVAAADKLPRGATKAANEALADARAALKE